MNFEKIKKKYPKAWEMFFVFIATESERDYQLQKYGDLELERGGISTVPESLSGWLYKFFDEQGIVVQLYFHNYHGWSALVGNMKKEIIKHRWTSMYEKTRQEAEQAAFTKAFEILENKNEVEP